MMQLSLFALFVVAIAAGAVLATPPPALIDPHVSTDKSVDWRTADRMLASVIQEGMTDEQKVLAVFHVTRRMFVHGPTPRRHAYDFHKVMHSLGTGACLSMTTPLAMLYERLGYECQSWVHDGHHMMQVKYGGRWHCLDPHMTFYCYDRSTPRQIASLEQLQNDPTLAFDAVKEGRAGEGYLLCGDSPKWFAGKGGRWVLERGGRWPKLTIAEPAGRITLRKGETYVRTWKPGKYWFKAGWLTRDQCGPIHHCRTADRKDTANWPLYEPHVWQGAKGTVYRHWGAGRIVFQPDLRDSDYTYALAGAQTNLHVDRFLAQKDKSKTAEAVIAVDCPYVITAGELKLVTNGKGAVAAAVKVNDARPANVSDLQGPKCGPIQLAYDWTDVPLAAGEPTALQGTFVEPVNGCFAGYLLRLRLTGGVEVRGLTLTSHFQLNRFSLPHLLPGRNVVTVSVEYVGLPLTVTYKWAEGPGWTQQRTVTRKITDRKTTFVIDVAGSKWPRMESLVLSVGP